MNPQSMYASLRTAGVSGLVAFALASCGAQENAAADTVNAPDDTEVQELPEGFTLPPNTRVTSRDYIDNESGEGWVLYLEGSATVEAVESHFENEAQAGGFETEFRVNSGGQRQLYGLRSDGMMLDLSAGSYADGSTRISLAIGREK